MKRTMPSALVSLVLTALMMVATGCAPAQDAREQGPKQARNVILFLADAGGLSVVSGASLMGYGEPLRLHVQHWPHLGLSETSPVDEFVSDSANGMSSIMTGIKTRNGVISESADAVRGERDGLPAKTLLEYAEEHGLATAMITTQSIADATPAATYAHANDRNKWGEIFPQAFAPRFGDGVDILFGAGRGKLSEKLREAGTSFEALSERHGRPIYSRLDEVPASDTRPVVVADEMDVHAATLRALDILQKSPKGYFLIVEWDVHTGDPREGLQNVVDFDNLVAEVQSRVDLDDTLLLFTADHSYGFQVDGGRRGEALLAGYAEWQESESDGDLVRLRNLMVNGSHTGEAVPALAIGAGAERVSGWFPNTYLFEVMLKAWGWERDPEPGQRP